MAAVAGQGTTFNLPNYTGSIINLSPLDTPFLTAISGLSAQNFDGTVAGAIPTDSYLFQWQDFDLRAAQDNRQRLEGAPAPAREARDRSNRFNIVEVHQEAFELSYTKQAATGQYGATGAGNPNAQGVAGVNPASPELVFQQRAHLQQIARDVEATFLTGTFNDPADNATARRTRGLIEATQTNAIDAGAAALSDTLINDLLQDVWEAGGITEQESAALMCNAFQKRAISAIYNPRGNEPRTRNVGGVRTEIITTDFGDLNLMLNRYMPAANLQVVSLEQCAPRVLVVPGRGIGFFVEPLAKTGASDDYQIYGEIGLQYGDERRHGKLTNLATS